MTANFSRRVLLNLDAEDYSSRNDVEQHEMQRDLRGVLEDAARQAGFDRTGWAVQPAGDGELAVLPPETSEQGVIDELTAALGHALAVHNSAAPVEARLRLRLGVHQGLVCPAASGYAGNGVVTVCRMVNSAPARRALIACPDANLVLLLSPSLYVELVLQRHTRLSATDFREVPVNIKKFSGMAWLHVPGYDVHTLALDGDPSPDQNETPADGVKPEPSTFTTNIRGGLHSKNTVIGIQQGYSR